MASERARARRRAARARARAAWQWDKGRSRAEWARWRAAVRVGLAPPARDATMTLFRALNAAGASSFTTALMGMAQTPNARALAWQRAEVAGASIDALVVRALLPSLTGESSVSAMLATSAVPGASAIARRRGVIRAESFGGDDAR